MHVEVGDDPVPVGERLRLVPSLRPPPTACVLVQAIEAFGDVVERGTGGRRPSCEGVLLARLLVLRELSSAAAASSGCEETSGGSTIAQPAAAASSRRREAVRRRDDDRGGPEDLRPRLARDAGSHMDAVAQPDRDRRPRGEPGRPEDDRLPAVEAAQRAQAARTTGSPPAEVSITTQLVFVAGAKSSGSTPAGTTVNAPGKRSRAAGCDAVVRRDQAVDPREQTVPLRLAGREAKRSGSTNVAAVVVSASSSAT